MRLIVTMLGLLFYCNIISAKEQYSLVVWANWDIKNEISNDDPVYDYLSDYECPNPPFLGRLIEHPNLVHISLDLVESSFFKRNANALVNLGQKLVNYKELPDNDGIEKVHPLGLDGIIVYSSKPKPRFMSLTTPRNYKHKIKTYYIKNINDKASIQDAFCKAIPHYTGIPK